MEKQKRVLVIDDEKVMARLVSGILARQGYETQTAASVQEALEALGRQSFHLITCDLLLPDISGLDFLKMMKAGETPADVPLILITGLWDARRLEEAREQGAVGVLTKPFSPHQLIEAAAAALGPA